MTSIPTQAQNTSFASIGGDLGKTENIAKRNSQKHTSYQNIPSLPMDILVGQIMVTARASKFIEVTPMLTRMTPLRKRCWTVVGPRLR